MSIMLSKVIKSGKYNSIGRVSDCGSGSSWFEPRYLPFITWNIISPNTIQSIHNHRMLFLIKNVLILKKLFSNILENSIFLRKFILMTHQGLYKKDFYKNRAVFKSMFSTSILPTSVLGAGGSGFKQSRAGHELTKSLFDYFLYVNTWLPSNRVQPHQSFKIFYMYNSYLNVGYFNIRKIFVLWKNIVTFMSNIFFYNVKFVTFGNSYFKNEIMALNWKILSFLKASWRYTHPFIFFFKNKTTRYNKIYFDYLTRLNLRVAFIVDVYYCNRTIYYCDVFKILTVGAVPISSNFYTLSIALPAASNLSFSNYFFIRLVLKIKKHTQQQMFNQLPQSYYKIT